MPQDDSGQPSYSTGAGFRFSEDERRVVAAAQARFLQVLQVIADLHNMQGQYTLADDLGGLVPVSQMSTQPQPKD